MSASGRKRTLGQLPAQAMLTSTFETQADSAGGLSHPLEGGQLCMCLIAGRTGHKIEW